MFDALVIKKIIVMKKILLNLFVLISIVSCTADDNDNNVVEDNNTIIGRWHLMGFEDTVMYDFKDGLRYTIYSTNSVFGDTETFAIPNPNPWSVESNILTIDLFFGNTSITTLSFRCNGNVVDLLEDNGSINSTLFREGYDISNCN